MIDEVVVPSKGLSAFSNFRPGYTNREADNRRQEGSVLSIFAFMDKKHLTVLIPAIFLTFIAGVIKPIITILLGRIFDDLISFKSEDINEQELLNSVSKWCVALTGLGVATMAVNGGFFSLWLVFGELQARNARDKAFQCMIRKETEWYDYRADGIGSLLVRIQTQIRELQTASSQPFGFCIEDAATALAALGIAFYYSWNLTLVILGFVPLTVMLLAVVTRKLKPAIENQKRDLSEASKRSYIAIKAVDVVKVFNGQNLEIFQYRCAIKKATESYLVQANTNSLQIGIMRFMTTAMFVVGFWYGIVLLRRGLDSGSVLTTFYSCLMATQAVEGLLPQWLVLAKGMSAGETLKNFFLQVDYGRNISKLAGTVMPTTCHGNVELSKLSVTMVSKVYCSSLFGLQVTFSYPSNPCQNAIENASFLFPAGKMTFVVGRSGSGKSTLGNLLTRSYQPSSGTIWIDDQSIQTLDLTWLRSNVFCVQQESILFNETLSRNIAFGRRPYISVAEDDVKTASQMAMLQQTIDDLPQGLQTNIGCKGVLLSGGQRQRVAIARARIHNAKILILDEATCALDRTCKKLLMDAIRRWRDGRTTIVITHDISEIKENNYIYVLEKGNVVQEGYHKQLLEEGKGLFAAFEFSSHGDSENPISDSAVVQSLDKSEYMPYERSNSHTSASPGDEWLRTDRQNRSRAQRVSRFFGLDEQLSRNGQMSNQRVRRGVGMSSIFANTLHVKDTWQSESVPSIPIPSIPRPLHSSMSKPLPALPIQSQARRSSRSDRTVLEDESLEVEMIDMSGSSAIKNRLQTSELQRNVQNPGGTGPDLNSSPPLAIGRESPQRRSMASIPPTSRDVEDSISSILRTLWPNLSSRDRITLILGFVSAFISASATPAFSYVLARLLGTFSLGSEQAEAAKTWALAILVIAAADGISSYYMRYLLEYCGQTWISTLRVEALKRILAQPKAWFDKPKNTPGRLSECLDRDAEEVRNIIGRFVGYMFLAGSMVLIAIVWAFIICWKLTLVSLASGPCMYAFTRAFEIVSGKWEKRLNEMADTTGDVFAETFSKIKTVRALSLENYFEEKYSKATVAAYQVGLRRAMHTSIFFGISDSTNLFVTALILYYGTVIAASGAWSINSILQVITLLLFSSGNANAAIAFIPQISSSRAAASQLLHLARMPRTASHESQGRVRLPTPLPIHLTSLSFSYPSNPAFKVLHNLSMTITANTCTAIVGPSGSGKSTIAALLVALRPPSSRLSDPPHTVTNTTAPLNFHNTPISHLDIPALRSQIALVPQDPFLFPATIAANIAYGLPSHSPWRTTHNLQSAARAAGIHDFIMSLPHGYNTRIGGSSIGDGDDDGHDSSGAGSSNGSCSGSSSMGLSGGQAQRLCIARALVRKPKVLVLDEPTSALDVESARAIRETIAGLVGNGGGVAVVLITHSVPMMRVAGRIVVLEGGRVVQEGSYAQLVRERGGPFVRLVSGGREDGGEGSSVG